MSEILLKHLEGMLSVDWPTLIVIAVFCALASYVLKEYLTIPPMIVFIYPLLVVFSVMIHYIFNTMEMFAPKKLDQWLMWTIMASIIGNIIGIGLVACFAHMRERLGHRPT